MARFTDTISILEVDDFAPKMPGVYEIGLVRNGEFDAYYVGKSDAQTTTIRARLLAHRNGAGNRFVAEYMKEHSMPGTRNHLRCRWFVCTQLIADEVERNLLDTLGWGKDGQYIWNIRGRARAF